MDVRRHFPTVDELKPTLPNPDRRWSRGLDGWWLAEHTRATRSSFCTDSGTASACSVIQTSAISRSMERAGGRHR